MRVPSAMTHTFSRVPNVEIPRSQFDRSFCAKTTFDAGWLVPVFVDEALPGDTYNVNMTAFARLATPLKPFMDNLVLESFFFAVPYRLVWDNWEKFNGAQVDPGDSTDFVIPTMTSTVGTGYLVGSLHDYFGLPTGVPGMEHSSLWHRAYNLIYNEWFRDQNLQDSVVVDRDDGPDTVGDYVLLRRGKRYDYFTSCLPWPQKGDAIELPLGTTAPVWGSSAVPTSLTPNESPVEAIFLDRSTTDGAAIFRARNADGTDIASPWALEYSGTPSGVGTGSGQGRRVFLNEAQSVAFDASAVAPWYADLSSATAATINQIRQAFQVQRLYERDARGGTRYTEVVLSHFGVKSPDARLQRPEYLGGGSSPVNVNAIAQTSSTDATTPQGNLAAMGTAVAQNHGFVKSFTEHCLLLGLVSVRADLSYQQGLNRMFSRSTRWDFYWPSLAHIGEQAVLNKEIYAVGTGGATDDEVFGYQERFAEYRYKPSQITGQFRSTYATPLDMWHLAQEFSGLPVLNASFIVEDPPVDRVIAVTSEPHFLFDSFFKMKCARPMPVFGVPGMIDHF